MDTTPEDLGEAVTETMSPHLIVAGHVDDATFAERTGRPLTDALRGSISRGTAHRTERGLVCDPADGDAEPYTWASA